MTFQEFLDNTYLAYRGKIASKTPIFGSDKANIVLSIANRLTRQWAKDTKYHWKSLFDIKNITPSISASTFHYDLDSKFILPSDYFIVTKTTGEDVQVSVTNPQKRSNDNYKFYISGNNPKTVNFTTIEPSFVGGTLKAPGYYMPADMTSANDNLAVDDPEWLIYATAAELSRNDPAKEDQFSNLYGIANDLYLKMAAANRDLGFNQNNTVPSNMPQISPDLDVDQAFEL